MKFDLSGRVALVTGASSGLEAHFARVLAGAGAHVAIHARRPDRLERLATELIGAGGRVFPAELDVQDPGQAASVVERGSRELGGIDVLVNNAGVTLSKAAMDYSEADFDAVLDVNLRGAFTLAQETARTMGWKGGSIINIGSTIRLRQSGQVAAYAISKAGVI